MVTAAQPLVYVLAFVAVVLLVQTVAGLIFSANDRAKTVNRRLAMLDSGMSREAVYSALVRKAPVSRSTDQRLQRWHDAIETFLRQAGLSISPLHLLAIASGVAGAIWLAALSLASSDSGLGFLVNGALSFLAAAVASGVGCWLWINRLRGQRIKKLEEQLPLALDVINRAVRAGHPVIAAVQLASDELGDPVGSEFGLIVDETTYGVDFKEALANFARRTGSGDAHFFAVSVSIQSETGGNLAEILEGLATVIRGRQSLGKRVRSLASEGRASAVLLSVLPVLLIAFQLLFNPGVYSSKFSDPIFWPTVAVTLAVYGVGWVIVHRIINFKY